MYVLSKETEETIISCIVKILENETRLDTKAITNRIFLHEGKSYNSKLIESILHLLMKENIVIRNASIWELAKQKSENDNKNIQNEETQYNQVNISDFFSGSSFTLFRKYCKKRKIEYVIELVDYNFDKLINETSFGITKIKRIKDKFKTFNYNAPKTTINKSEYERAIINKLKLEMISEGTLNQLPLFYNECIKLKFDELNSSFKTNNLVDYLLLTIRAKHVLSILKIEVLGELLFLTPNQLMKIRNCGKTTIKDIQEIVKKYLLYQKFEYKSLKELIEYYPLKQREKDIFFWYLGVGQDQFPTLQTIGEKYDCTRERIRQIVSKCIEFFQKAYQNHELDDFNIPLELILDTYKGSICFESIKEDLSDLLAWDVDIETHSYIRFWNEVTKNIEYDKKKKIFWKKNDKCVNCEYCRNFFTDNTINNKKNLLQQLEEYCRKEIACNYKKEKKFDKGLILFYLDEKVLKEKKKQHQEKPLRIDIDYFALCCKHKLEIDEKQEMLLEQLKKKEGIISGVRLDSLSRIKRIDFKTVIFNLNKEFRNKFGKDFIIFDSETDCWEINYIFNHPANWISKESEMRNNDAEVINTNILTTSNKEYPGWLLQQAEKIEHIFDHTFTTYKYYWFKALLTLVEQEKKEATFLQMAALMVAHAWQDVLVKKLNFQPQDQIPDIVRRIYLDSDLLLNDQFLNINKHLTSNITSYKNLLEPVIRFVPYRFLSIYVENLKGLKDSDKNEFIYNAINKKNCIYSFNQKTIIINEEWRKFLLNNLSKYKLLHQNLFKE